MSERLKNKESPWLLFQPKKNYPEQEVSIIRAWDIQENKLTGICSPPPRSSCNPSPVNSYFAKHRTSSLGPRCEKMAKRQGKRDWWWGQVELVKGQLQEEERLKG